MAPAPYTFWRACLLETHSLTAYTATAVPLIYSLSGNRLARPQPQFSHSRVLERFIYSQDQSTYFLQQKRQTIVGIYIIRSQTHECIEIGTEAPIILFWEYLLQIFGILSLQCMRTGACSRRWSRWADASHPSCWRTCMEFCPAGLEQSPSCSTTSSLKGYPRPCGHSLERWSLVTRGRWQPEPDP
jgi:hypothetical protein